jgi:hypothetical protein
MKLLESLETPISFRVMRGRQERPADRMILAPFTAQAVATADSINPMTDAALTPREMVNLRSCDAAT